MITYTKLKLLATFRTILIRSYKYCIARGGQTGEERNLDLVTVNFDF